MTTDAALPSATELIAHYRRKTLSPVDATQAVLERIERFDGAITGRITAPRDLQHGIGLKYPRELPLEDVFVSTEWLVEPPPAGEAAAAELRKDPNIVSVPDMPPLSDELSLCSARSTEGSTSERRPSAIGAAT